MFDNKETNPYKQFIQENQFLNKLFNDSVKQGLNFCEVMKRIEIAQDMLRINKLKKNYMT